jgi:hypothetical protein
MPCEASPAPIPCCACGGGPFEPPPPLGGGDDATGLLGGGDDATGLLGGGDDATGSPAGWLAAGLLSFVVGARTNEALLPAAAEVPFFVSGFSIFRLFPSARPAATGVAGAADRASGNCPDESPTNAFRASWAGFQASGNPPPRVSGRSRTAIARPPQKAREPQRPPSELRGASCSAFLSRRRVGFAPTAEDNNLLRNWINGQRPG